MPGPVHVFINLCMMRQAYPFLCRNALQTPLVQMSIHLLLSFG